MALWDGRFSGGPADEMLHFSESLTVDLRMFEEDIQGSIAHATMLAEVGLISDSERDVLVSGLQEVAVELREGAFRPGPDLEDIHMAVEHRLSELVGEVAGKLHTARSRNDQVATDVRLWLKKMLPELESGVQELVGVLLSRVRGEGRTLMPGYTHLQRGQPIWLGHQLLAHAWALMRDLERIRGAKSRVDRCPLGAGAMAGTPHPIDRVRTAELLGFSSVLENAMDAVSARDHSQEVASACAILMTRLSRMAAELVLFSSSEFGLLKLGDAWSTGSSIMPQKRNPDAAELVRGKSARVLGNLQALLSLSKGLPLAYMRDLQEDREALFGSVQTTMACVSVMAGTWRDLTVNADRYTAELEGDFLLATELADYLVEQGLPFREAHHVVGRLVLWCEERGGNFSLLDLNVLREHHELFGPEALSFLDPVSAIERRTSLGGTAWIEVQRQCDLLDSQLQDLKPAE
ncbi:MAG: argininosuccinate lyase [Myxococcota bacterium]|nr:argininosuccinate lyase [Myxococcota bacterium]